MPHTPIPADSPSRRTRSQLHLKTPSDDSASSQDESPPMDVSQMRAQFEKTPGRLPIAMTPRMKTPARTPARTPVRIGNGGVVSAIDPLRDRLEIDEVGDGGKKISPGLRQLRQTPGM